jgi:hypothetical protein
MERDHEARTMAQQAHGRIDGHERLCTERWEQSRLALARVERGVSGLYRRWWALATAIIGLLLASIGGAIYLGFKMAEIANIFGR